MFITTIQSIPPHPSHAWDGGKPQTWASIASELSPKGGSTRSAWRQILAIHFSSTAGVPSCSVRSSNAPSPSAGKNRRASPFLGTMVSSRSPLAWSSWSAAGSLPNLVVPPAPADPRRVGFGQKVKSQIAISLEIEPVALLTSLDVIQVH